MVLVAGRLRNHMAPAVSLARFNRRSADSDRSVAVRCLAVATFKGWRVIRFRRAYFDDPVVSLRGVYRRGLSLLSFFPHTHQREPTLYQPAELLEVELLRIFRTERATRKQCSRKQSSVPMRLLPPSLVPSTPFNRT